MIPTMKTREQKDRECRKREATWAAEDAAVQETLDPLIPLREQATEAWQSGQPIFTVRRVVSTLGLRIKDATESDDALTAMLATVEQVGWKLSKMSHYVTRDTNLSECGVFVFRRGD